MTPERGMGVTQHVGSDSYPWTVIDISKQGKRINVQADDYIRLDRNGRSNLQVYEYRQNKIGVIVSLLLRADGTWHSSKAAGRFVLGARERYYSFSF